jgi:choline dehydrogenase
VRYDVVVVGGGSAGCVLADRLSEDPARRVLLLEAGPDYRTVEALPADLASGWAPAFSHDWGLRAEPAADGHVLELARAKVMGGCSSTNATAALRGSPADYDAWAAAGNPGWSFQEVLPFFRALETDADFGGEPWHGDGGPLPIRRYRREELTGWSAAGLEAAVAAGHEPVEDHNRPGAVGAGPCPNNTLDGVRMSTSLTWLAAARGRPNLTVRPDTLVDRVVLAGGRAAGVRLAGGERVDAGRVVLAAGAYGSPVILLRSGVGPAGELAALGVPVAADLPGVGRNLTDHPLVRCAVPVRPGPPCPSFQVVVTWRSSLAADGDLLDLHALPGRSDLAGAESPTGATGFVLVGLMKPRSRGRLWLRSADPADPPHVDPAYLSHPDDLARMVEGLRMARALLRAGPLAALAAGPELAPGERVADGDQSALAAFVRADVSPYHHPVGTCAMGPDPAAGAVVDARGRVHGVDALVVADASVMPEIPAANTNLPTIMVGERIAAWLRA